jgi:hypothetical protein
MTADLAIFLAVLLVLAGIAIWLYKAGGYKIKAKIAEQVIKDQNEFAKRGEEWDGMGGVAGIVKRRMQWRKRNMPKK